MQDKVAAELPMKDKFTLPSSYRGLAECSCLYTKNGALRVLLVQATGSLMSPGIADQHHTISTSIHMYVQAQPAPQKPAYPMICGRWLLSD